MVRGQTNRGNVVDGVIADGNVWAKGDVLVEKELRAGGDMRFYESVLARNVTSGGIIEMERTLVAGLRGSVIESVDTSERGRKRGRWSREEESSRVDELLNAKIQKWFLDWTCVTDSWSKWEKVNEVLAEMADIERVEGAPKTPDDAASGVKGYPGRAEETDDWFREHVRENPFAKENVLWKRFEKM